MRDEHLALAQALCSRDPDRAEQIVQSQIARSQNRVLEALIRRLDGSALGGLSGAVQVNRLGS
jgi:DNA-binding GntR family transcriptional regulator